MPVFKRLPGDTFSGPVVDARGTSATAGGESISNTAQVIGFLNGTRHITAIPWNFSTAIVCYLRFCPYAWLLTTANALAALPSMTDWSSQGQQPGGTGVTLSSLDTLANGGAIFIGAQVPFRGIAVDMSAAVNANASVLLAEYWNGTGWVSLSASDGTASGGKTFAQDGNITWTVPTAWATDYLSNTMVYPPTAPSNLPSQLASLMTGNADNTSSPTKQYWTRLTVSAALDSSTVANTMFLLNQSTTGVQMLPNNALSFQVWKKHGGIAGYEAVTDAGTCQLVTAQFTDNPQDGF